MWSRRPKSRCATKIPVPRSGTIAAGNSTCFLLACESVSSARDMVLVTRPMGNNLRYNRVAHTISGLKRGHISTVAMYHIAGEAFRWGQPDRRLIKITDRAQNHHAIQINAPGVMEKRERL